MSMGWKDYRKWPQVENWTELCCQKELLIIGLFQLHKLLYKLLVRSIVDLTYALVRSIVDLTTFLFSYLITYWKHFGEEDLGAVCIIAHPPKYFDKRVVEVRVSIAAPSAQSWPHVFCTFLAVLCLINRDNSLLGIKLK